MAEQPSAIARFFGYAMMAIGVLMVLLSGACTLFCVTLGLAPKGQGGDIGLVWAGLGIGLPCVAIGVGLIVGGRVLSRRRKPTEPPDGVF